MNIVGHSLRLTLIASALAGCLAVDSAIAADSTAAEPPIVVGGYVDTYFSYNLARPSSHVNELRNFDVTDNSFTMATAEISITRAAAPVGFRLDADFGPTNDLVQSGATGSVANIGQAYVTYIVPLGKGLTVDAGKFVTHMGFEVIKAKDNFNYSRALLFALPIPYYHIGARASYPLTDQLTANGYVYNSYNGLTVNKRKTFGLEALYAATSSLTLVGNWIGGPAQADTVSKRFRNVAELIASYAATEKLTLAADGVYGEENFDFGTVTWKGVALYAKYAFCPTSSFALRGEVYTDPMGATTGIPGGADLSEVTLTYEYRPTSSLILRAEYRYDNENNDTVAIYDGIDGAGVRHNQSTLTAAAIVVF